VLETALEFLQQDTSYRGYDRAPVKQDDVLTETDISAANAMIARIYERAPEINAALARIPPSTSLAEPPASVPWQAIEELMRAMQVVATARNQRQIARATKPQK
jgi:hypothetical protein